MAKIGDLDDRWHLSRFARFASRFGGYWCVSLGLIGLVVGCVDLLRGGRDAPASFALGAVAIGIGLFIGPKGMIRRLWRRP